MADLNILSWNVQKFGSRKAQDQAFCDFVADLIIVNDVQFVGLMEIVGWVGQEVRINLVSTLNQKTASQDWTGEESEMTPSKPHEQYVFLWNKKRIQVNRFWLLGVVGDNAFKDLFTLCKFSDDDVAKFWTVMIKKAYLDKDFSVNIKSKACKALGPPPPKTNGYKTFDLTPDFPLPFTDAQKQALVSTLLNEEIVGFPYRNSRPPFLAQCALPNGSQILLTLFHAPGPTGTWPMLASNTLAWVPEIQHNTPSVILGDFNVGAAHMQQAFALTELDPDGVIVPFTAGGQTCALRPFEALTGPGSGGFTCLKYSLLLQDDLTSITTDIPGPNKVPSDKTIGNVLRSPYDKFLVWAAQTVTASARTVNLIDEILPKRTSTGKLISTTTLPFSGALSRDAVRAFTGWYKDQADRRFVPEILKKMDAKLSAIDSLAAAHYTYRYAISDHLPIVLSLKNL